MGGGRDGVFGVNSASEEKKKEGGRKTSSLNIMEHRETQINSWSENIRESKL